MIPISEIPNLNDGDCVPIIEGTLKQINPIETKESKDKVDASGHPKKYRSQWYVIESLSGSILVSTFNEAMFIPESEAGKEVKLCAQKVNGVYKGLEKTSYTKADGKTSVSVQAGNGCIKTIKQPKSETPQPPSPMLEPKQSSPCANQPPASNSYENMARLHAYAFCCLTEAYELQGVTSTPEAISAAATGILIQHHFDPPKAIARKAPSKPDAVPVKQPETPTRESKKQPLTTEQLATKVIGGMKIAPEMLEGANLEAVFDMCYKDASNDIPVASLNAAFDEIKARVKSEAKLYPSLLMRWDDYIAKAKSLQAKPMEFGIDDTDIPF